MRLCILFVLLTTPARTLRAMPLMCATEPPPPKQTTSLSALSALASTQDESIAITPMISTACAAPTPSERRRSVILAAAAPLAATALYAFQRANPVSPVNLLALMEERSPALPDALASGRATCVEFYAPWCISCKESAPSMLRFEKRFGDRINFVTINGDDPRNAELVRLFSVDAVPHLALIGSDRKLKGTLIGEVPPAVVESSLEKLGEGEQLPL